MEIKQALEEYYNKQKAGIYVLLFIAFALIVLPIYYEYSIGWMHVSSLARLSLASVYTILIFVSGACFGAAIKWRHTLKKIMRQF